MVALTRAPWAERFGLYYDLLDHNARAFDVVRFLRDVHRHVHRPLLLVCDRLAVHRSAVRRIQEEGGCWLDVSWLPAYAPELDPVEDVWNQSKYGELANVIPESISQLHSQLDKLFDEYRHDPDRLRSFFQTAHLT